VIYFESSLHVLPTSTSHHNPPSHPPAIHSKQTTHNHATRFASFVFAGINRDYRVWDFWGRQGGLVSGYLPSSFTLNLFYDIENVHLEELTQHLTGDKK